MRIPETLGFRGKYFVSSSFITGTPTPSWVAYNMATVAGYLPLVGAIVGIWRIASQGFHAGQKGVHGWEPFQIARGVVEVLGLGSLLLIPDLVVTIRRAWRSSQASKLD